MGLPVSEEMPFADGGLIQKFERGSIYWWSDIGAIDLGTISLRYKGLYCFSTTGGYGADEPYVTIGMAPTPENGTTSSMRSNIYDDTDGGDSRPDAVELYRGRPWGVQLAFGLWEHDSGDQDVVANLFKEAANAAAQQAVEAYAGQGGHSGGYMPEDLGRLCSRRGQYHTRCDLGRWRRQNYYVELEHLG
jgi:hypothetical protein